MGKKEDEANVSTAAPVIPSAIKGEHIEIMKTERKCTDLCCLFLFILFWIGMFIVLGVARANGRPEKLIYGTDWKGRTCGSQKKSNDSTLESYDFRDYKYIYYPRLQEDLYQMQLASITSKSSNFFNFLTGICVKECPVLPLNDSASPLYAHAYSYKNYDKKPINTDSSATNDAHAQSPWRINLNSSGIFYRCLSLEKVETNVSIRCVDPCKENQTMYCGRSATNSFMSCGGSDCSKIIEQYFPKCTTTQQSELVITTGSAHPSPIYDSLTSGWRLVSRWLGDLQKSIIPILVCGGLAAIVVSFVWIILMKYCAGVMVWGAIVSVVAVFLGTTVYLCYRGDLIPTSKVSSYMDQYNITINTQYLSKLDTTVNRYTSVNDANKKHFWAVSAYVFIAIDLLLFCFIIAMTSHVNIAIGIVKQASKAIKKMPSLLLFPIAPTIAVIALVIYWIVVATYIATAGKIKLENVADVINEQTNQNITQYYDGFTKYEDKNVVRYLILYHLFGFLWTSEFLQSIGYMIVSGAICQYYWTRDKKELGWFPVLHSIWRVFRYHLGTICFGSLIIALIQLVRIILEYVDKKTKELQQSNNIIKFIVKCLKCCLWCFEKCLQFINRNAYIVTAMKGTSFVSSVKTAFSLLFENAARVGTVSVISFLVLLLAKLCITCLCCVLMFVFIHNPPKKLPTIILGDLEDVSSPIFPMIMTGLMAYAIATAFIGIYETTIDTILLCFCEDCRINKESGDYYMSKGMRKYIDGDAKKYAFSHYNKEGQKDEKK